MEVVNGYVCRNCTDVEYAKKGVDPARPKDGPNGVNAAGGSKAADKAKADRGVDDQGPGFGPAVQLSGAPASVQASGDAAKVQPEARPYRPGAISSISA